MRNIGRIHPPRGSSGFERTRGGLTVSSVIAEIGLLLGAIMEQAESPAEAAALAKGYRHEAITAFVRTFRTKASLAIFGISCGNTNIPEDFIKHYDKLIGVPDPG